MIEWMNEIFLKTNLHITTRTRRFSSLNSPIFDYFKLSPCKSALNICFFSCFIIDANWYPQKITKIETIWKFWLFGNDVIDILSSWRIKKFVKTFLIILNIKCKKWCNIQKYSIKWLYTVLFGWITLLQTNFRQSFK